MKKLMFMMFFLLVFAASCNGQENQVNLPEEIINETEPVDMEPPPPDPTAEPSEETAPTEPPLDFPPLIIHNLEAGTGMAGAGPWLVFSHYDGMWVVDTGAGEAGYMPLGGDEGMLTVFPSPATGLLAMVKYNPYDLTARLEIIYIKDFNHFLDLDLLAYDGEPLSFENEDLARDFEVDRTFAVTRPPVWSHGGSKLAFVGSHQGPSPDVYVYDVLTGEVKQLTFGPSHAVNLSWSPDDEYIYHAGVGKLYVDYSGGGYSGWTYYAAAADGSGVLTVLNSALDQVYENVLGWFSDREVIMDSEHWWCGRFDLRMVYIEMGAVFSIWLDRYDHIAYDPVNSMGLVWVSPDPPAGPECGETLDTGMFLVYVPHSGREKVTAFDDITFVNRIEWSQEAGLFIVETKDSWALVTTDGEVEFLDGKPFFSQDGEMMAVLSMDGKGLTVINGSGSAHPIPTSGKLLHPTWSPDAASLFFFAENPDADLYDLYIAAAPDYTPVLILEEALDRFSDPPVWLMP